MFIQLVELVMQRVKFGAIVFAEMLLVFNMAMLFNKLAYGFHFFGIRHFIGNHLHHIANMHYSPSLPVHLIRHRVIGSLCSRRTRFIVQFLNQAHGFRAGQFLRLRCV